MLLKNIIAENHKFDNWVWPDDKQLRLEYKIEYQIKPLKAMTNDAFPTFEDFERAVKAAEVKEITPEMDRHIGYRASPDTKEGLLSLIKGYASYPEFRNEKTLDAIFDGFENNAPMTMPIVLRFPNGSLRIMGGNTRMSAAFISGINPKVLIVDVPKVA